MDKKSGRLFAILAASFCLLLAAWNIVAVLLNLQTITLLGWIIHSLRIICLVGLGISLFARNKKVVLVFVILGIVSLCYGIVAKTISYIREKKEFDPVYYSFTGTWSSLDKPVELIIDILLLLPCAAMVVLLIMAMKKKQFVKKTWFVPASLYLICDLLLEYGISIDNYGTYQTALFRGLPLLFRLKFDRFFNGATGWFGFFFNPVTWLCFFCFFFFTGLWLMKEIPLKAPVPDTKKARNDIYQDVARELEKCKELFDTGEISQEEYDQKKQELLKLL